MTQDGDCPPPVLAFLLPPPNPHMLPPTMRRLHRTMLLALRAAAVLAPAIAMAQESAPPAPALSRWLPPWVGYIVMVLLLALVMGVSLMPSKRGHQD